MESLHVYSPLFVPLRTRHIPPGPEPQLDNSCIDDTPFCPYIDEYIGPNDDDGRSGFALAFRTEPVPMIGGATYTVYIGLYCEYTPCDPLDPILTQPSNITITPWPCDATQFPTPLPVGSTACARCSVACGPRAHDGGLLCYLRKQPGR